MRTTLLIVLWLPWVNPSPVSNNTPTQDTPFPFRVTSHRVSIINPGVLILKKKFDLITHKEYFDNITHLWTVLHDDIIHLWGLGHPGAELRNIGSSTHQNTSRPVQLTIQLNLDSHTKIMMITILLIILHQIWTRENEAIRRYNIQDHE